MLSRSILAIAVLVAAAACSPPASGGDDPQPAPPEPVRFDKPAMVRFHMQRHFDDLQEIERLLLAGKLDDARARAFLLTKPAPDPGMQRWADEVDAVTAAARAVVAAPGIDEAVRREARVAEACANCHLRTQKSPVFAAPPAVPADDGTAAARMARHQWATDRLWEAMIGGSRRPWRAGLDVLVATPPPYSPVTDAPALATRLQTLARASLDKLLDGSETLEGRTRAYGEMLVTCAACHRSVATVR